MYPYNRVQYRTHSVRNTHNPYWTLISLCMCILNREGNQMTFDLQIRQVPYQTFPSTYRFHLVKLHLSSMRWELLCKQKSGWMHTKLGQLLGHLSSTVGKRESLVWNLSGSYSLDISFRQTSTESSTSAWDIIDKSLNWSGISFSALDIDFLPIPKKDVQLVRYCTQLNLVTESLVWNLSNLKVKCHLISFTI
jgi:hypothetical protein